MGDFRIGSIFGFEIRLDFSWFIIFFLILWVFTFAVFPVNYPGLSIGAYIGMGIVGTLLFFASLLAHEISHSLVARAKGIPVEGITLFIFGGMSRTRQEAETPGDEFQIAAVGPLSSFVIAALFWGAAWLAFRGRWSLAIVGVAQYLALLNLLLALFNLLPGFPLDGGRIFRAAVWKWTGDYTRATRWSTTGGKWLAYILIAFGLLSVFQGNLGGLWLVLIGWFLRNAAIASYQQHLLQQVLEHVRARDAMTPDPETVEPDLTLQQLVDEHFLRRRYHAFPVATDGRPLGLITFGQVKEVPREEWPHRTVAETMTSIEGDGVTVRPDEPMTEVLRKMERSGSRRVLVTRDGRLEGIITTGDVAGWLQRARELEG